MQDRMTNSSTSIEQHGSSEDGERDQPDEAGKSQDYATSDEEIKSILKNHSLCFELMWNLFVAATKSYRFSSILRPFPPMFKNGDEKNIYALRDSISRVPPMTSTPDVFWTSLPNDCKELIAWSLTVGQFQLKLKDKAKEFPLIKELTGQIMDTPEPSFVFEVIPSTDADMKFEQLRAGRKSFYAYHGSRFDNFFSILHIGLNTHLNKVAVFGEGTYLSSELSVSLMYSQAGQGWKHCSLGSRLSCVAVCQMIDDPSVKCQIKEGSAALKKSRAQASKQTDSVPEKYYVVQRNDVIRVKYLLVYKENKPQAQVASSSTSFAWLRENKFPLLMLAYLLLLIVIGMLSSQSTVRSISRFFKSLTS